MGSALLLPRYGGFIRQKTLKSETAGKKPQSNKAAQCPRFTCPSLLPGTGSVVICLPQLPPHPCLCLPISHALAELMKDDGAGPPERRGRRITRAGEREVQWGLHGHCWRRTNKGSRWLITEIGAFCSGGAVEHTSCRPGCALCLLIKDGHDLLVTSSGPVFPDPGCFRGSLCRAELCRTWDTLAASPQGAWGIPRHRDSVACSVRWLEKSLAQFRTSPCAFPNISHVWFRSQHRQRMAFRCFGGFF